MDSVIYWWCKFGDDWVIGCKVVIDNTILTELLNTISKRISPFTYRQKFCQDLIR